MAKALPSVLASLSCGSAMTRAWLMIYIAAALYAGFQSIFMAWVVPAIWL